MRKKTIPLTALTIGLFFPLDAFSQPAISRGHQNLPINYAECLARAHCAFQAEGFSSSPSRGESYVYGVKGIHAGYITCGGVLGQLDVNVFIASESRDGNVPGAERVRLQQRMYAGCGEYWEVTGAGGWTAVWTRRGDSNIYDGVWTGPQKQKGTTVIEITIIGNRMTGNRTWSSDETLCTYTGQVAPGGGSVSGTGTCTTGPQWNWSAVIHTP